MTGIFTFPFRFCASMVLVCWSMQSARASQEFTYSQSGELINAVTTGASTAPVITNDPRSGTIETGAPLALSVVATGSAPLTYQWFKGGDPIPGATGSTLVFSPLTASDAGSYTVRVTNGAGFDDSNPAVLSMPPNLFSTPLGGPAVDWTTGGTTIWKVITDPAKTHDGVSAVGTGQVFQDASYLQGSITVASPSTLSFWVKFDAGRFLLKLNGQTVRDSYDGMPSGTWNQVFVHLQPGTFTLNWSYEAEGAGGITLDELTVIPSTDTDSDSLSDQWETEYFGDLTRTAEEDSDGDGNSNVVEYHDHTRPDSSYSIIKHVNLTIVGNGDVDVDPAEPALGYETNAQVNLTVAPDSGNVFAGWTGENTSNLSAISLTFANQSLNIAAHFSPSIPLGDAADTTGIAWTTGGDAPWVGQNVGTSDGVDALQSGSFTPGTGSKTSWVQCSVTGPAKLTYEYKARTRNNFGGFELTADGMKLLALPETDGWQTATIIVPPGTHLFRWTQTVPDPSTSKWTVSGLDKVNITAAPDTDADGLTDEWEITHFGDLTHTGESDYDSDGVDNETEFAEFTSPASSSSRRFRITLTQEGNGSAAVTPVRPAYLGGEVVHFSSSAAANWSLEAWQGLAGGDEEQVDIAVHSDLNVNAVFVPANTLNEVLDNDELVFQNSLPGWRKTTATTHDGVDAAITPLLEPNQEATISTVVSGPRILSFWWKSNGAPSTAYFQDNGAILTLDRENEWERQFVQLPAGSHTLEWNFSSSDVNTSAWLDEVLAEIDTDQDGLPDDWEMEHFSSLAPVANGDPDNDDSSNQSEWADGTDPNSATSAKYYLELVRDEYGSVQVSPEKRWYAPGEQVTFTPDPAFKSWSGDASGSAAPLILTMNGNKTVNAHFHPVAEGADNTELIFVDGGAAPWIRDSWNNTPGEPDVARSPAGLALGQQSWVQTTVTGPGLLAFKARGTYSNTSSQFLWEIDGVEAGRLPNFYADKDASYILPAGAHTVRWIFVQGEDVDSPSAGVLDSITFSPLADFIPLDIALDTTGITWNTGASATWLGTAAGSHDGVDAAETIPVGHDQSAELSAVNVTGNKLLTFWWKVSSEESRDYLSFLIDGVQSAQVTPISGETGWAKVTVVVPTGTHTLSWRYAKDSYYTEGDDKAWVDEVSFTDLPSLSTALDTTGITWVTGGDLPWSGTTLSSHDGVDAAASGAINENGESWVQTQLTGPGTLTFWWKVSSEESFDFLSLLVDGTPRASISGETAWAQIATSITSGSHTVRWLYSKDYTTTGGQDAGFVDKVTFVPSSVTPVQISFPTIGARQFSLTAIGLRATASNGQAVTYSVSGPARLSGNTLILTGLGNVTVTARNSGVSATQTFKVSDSTKPKLSDTTRSVSTTGSSATIRGRAKDNHQVRSLYYRVIGPDGQRSAFKRVKVGSAPGKVKSFSFKVSLPDPGEYSIVMYCVDASGNKSGTAKSKVTKKD